MALDPWIRAHMELRERSEATSGGEEPGGGGGQGGALRFSRSLVVYLEKIGDVWVLIGDFRKGLSAYLLALKEAGGVLWEGDVVERVSRKVAGALMGSAEVVKSEKV